MFLRRFRLALPLAFVVLFVDCTTQEFAVEALSPERVPHDVAGDVLRFTLVYNEHAAMGLPFGAFGRWPLIAVGVAILAALVWLLWRTPLRDRWQRIALGLVLGGAVGNLLSRVRFDRGVVDFIDVGIGHSRFFIFNVADIGVCVGAGLLALVLWRDRESPDAGISAR